MIINNSLIKIVSCALFMMFFFLLNISSQEERIQAPLITQAACIPNTIPADGNTVFSVVAHVTDPDSHANLAHVNVDLSAIGGSSSLVMYDDGTHGDLHPGDSVFTLGNLTVPLNWFLGDFALTITAYDLQNDSTQESAWIHVVEINTAPVMGTVNVNPATVPADGTTQFSVSAGVMDANIAAVTVNLFEIGGDSLTVMNDDNDDDIYSVDGLTISPGTLTGTYTLTVKATDDFGLVGTGTTQITIVQPYEPPVVGWVTCQPLSVPADGLSEFVITAKVTDLNGQSDISDVTLDLTAISGSSSVTMYDDGSNGDITAMDSIYTIGGLTVSESVMPGPYTLIVTAVDEQSLTHTADVTINVVLGNQAPAISNIEFSPSSVPANGVSVFTISANVEDMNGLADIDRVEIDLSAIGGSSNVLLFDDGTHGDLTAGNGVYTLDSQTVAIGTPAGSQFLEVTAYDLGGLSGNNTSNLEVTDPVDIFENNLKPAVYALHPNYPNPFNPSTTISFDLPARSNVQLKIFNLLGQEVRTLTKKTLPAGRYYIPWNGKDNAGYAVASGIYIYRIEAVSQSGLKQIFTRTRKMIMMK